MALNTVNLLTKLGSYVKRTGRAKRVVLYDPMSQVPPGTISISIRSVRAFNQISALNKTGVCIVFSIVLYIDSKAEPKDGQELELMGVFDLLMQSFNEKFTLEGAVHSIDIFGRAGTPLGADFGRVEIDKVIYRVMDITLPLLVTNVWTQGS